MFGSLSDVLKCLLPCTSISMPGIKLSKEALIVTELRCTPQRESKKLHDIT